MNRAIINMLKTLQEKYKSNWKNHPLLLTTTQSIEQPALHPVFCYFSSIPKIMSTGSAYEKPFREARDREVTKFLGQ